MIYRCETDSKKKFGKKRIQKTGRVAAGIGVSAGGLESVPAFLNELPPDAEISFVIVQSLEKCSLWKVPSGGNRSRGSIGIELKI